MAFMWVGRWFFLDVFTRFCAHRFLVESTVPTGAAVVTVLFVEAGLLVAFVDGLGETTVL